MDWMSNRMIALYIALGVIVAGVVAWLVLGKTVRTRLRMEKLLSNDSDINDWLIIFNWTPKILYLPTIMISIIASLLMTLKGVGWFFEAVTPEMIGGFWLALFFVNFLVEEFEISVKLLLITIIGLLTVFISWLRGLFYYVAITPNYMNLQEGPTETGEQIGREDYNTRVDTSDFLERLLGFGKIIITFKDQKRQPIALLVWRIDKKAQLLEIVRGKFAIDLDSHPQPSASTE